MLISKDHVTKTASPARRCWFCHGFDLARTRIERGPFATELEATREGLRMHERGMTTVKVWSEPEGARA